MSEQVPNMDVKADMVPLRRRCKFYLGCFALLLILDSTQGTFGRTPSLLLAEA